MSQSNVFVGQFKKVRKKWLHWWDHAKNFLGFIQGQIYHRAGSLLPVSDSDNKFLQIYFMGNSPQEIDLRCAHNNLVKRSIVEQLQTLFHQHNQLIILFKTALDLMPSDNHKIVIRADKTPAVGENLESRDIVLHRRNFQLQPIKETHRSYDALQYPIIFWQGEDGYDLSIKMINPITGSETNKKVSSMNYYSYRLMIRENADNRILKCRRLYHKYVDDMYVKIETERLTFIRLNQTKLRSEEYIHLRDAINTDGNAQNVGRMTILPATYIGSPRHMHEYAQDAMSYVRHYGTADLFITFTCNPQWIEIKQELFPGQSPIDRHDITARVFRQKLKSLMNFIVKHNVFGETRCWMYSVEWQKRGLPHAHILIWLVEKIRPNEVDAVISAEIPNVQVDPGLHEVVIKNMIHGPCGTLNQNSPCMMDGKCSKRYPRTLISETITGNDGYPLYRRRSTADNGKSTIVKLNQQDIEIDNRWIVPYSPILSKTFKAHINVESCHSVKSIKYICKYVTKGSDMAVIGIGAENSNDEVTQYQMGRYVSSNEAVWRIFSFPIHERHPSVVHLAVHLENGQRVYFTAQNAVQRAAQPPSTTLTSFFETCQNDDFAQTLLYSEMPKYYTWNQSSRRFIRRKQGKPVPGYTDVYSTVAIGRIYSVHPSNDECFYLRLLLVNVRGPTSFQQLRTVDGELCGSYREACQRLQLLENDAHWDQTLNDAVISSHTHQIRTLFSIIISTCFPSNPIDLWMKYKDYMCDDILYQIRNRMGNPNIQITILAAKNIDVNELNFKIQEQITGELRIYKSVDSATNQDDVVNYPPEFLNSLDLPGLPPHNLQLKVGSVVIMLRNINQPRLCNGTRLAIKKLLNNVIEATILKGKYKGEDVLIPRIPMIPTDVPFEFKRLQFPVRLAFAMTINKSQGQTLSVCGINLENPCFSHGQLYVACSRVGKPSDLFIYAPGRSLSGQLVLYIKMNRKICS
ncbi:uncharacterized protein LOC143204485 [Rhynchophorus ferrugineus]|uniref:uncharacterized protein LOC143204485 n=1 Tax=Rhynchophorus ferrugineus TaxID=354439 RepID=UPI003FCC29C7